LDNFWLIFFPVGLAAAYLIYRVARRIKLYALVDTIWTTGLGLGALAFFLLSGPVTARDWVVLAIVLFWSGRLSLHLWQDRIVPGKEDPRYAALAAHWGARAQRNFVWVFLGQVPLAGLFLLPITLAFGHGDAAWRWLDTFGLGIALIALYGEFAADRQLARFRKNPANKGQVCRDGLWRYSRHPNYFFEWLHWFSYVAFAAGASHGIWAWVGPVMMFVFLRYITGVPFAERSSLRSRGEAYRKYQRTTSVFIPWRPQRDPNS
jgi:steroid 5-alpha reductase family enzyme